MFKHFRAKDYDDDDVGIGDDKDDNGDDVDDDVDE